MVVTLFDITEQKHLLNQVSKLFSVSTQQNQALRENKVSLLAYQRELQEAKEKSDALAESKASFLATMSHEIRTPMNAIIGMAYLALKTTLTPKQHDYVDKIYQAGKGLLIILNDILDFSKLESGKMQLDPHPVNIRKFVQNMMDVYDVLAQHKGLTLALVSPPTETGQSMPVVMIDEARLRQVLSNLLSNALKFTQHGGITIEVSQRYDVEQDNGQQVLVIISVHDTGIGITPEQQQHLFKDFAQADQTISRKFGGSGLGLAISAKIVALMGGEIQLTSTPNLGSTFTLVIPCDLASEPVSSARVPSDEDNALPSALPTFEMQGSDIQSQDVVASDMTVDEIFDKIKQALLQNNGAVIDMWYDHQTLLESTLGAECAKLVFQAIDSFDFDGAISQLNQCIENKK